MAINATQVEIKFSQAIEDNAGLVNMIVYSVGSATPLKTSSYKLSDDKQTLTVTMDAEIAAGSYNLVFTAGQVKSTTGKEIAATTQFFEVKGDTTAPTVTEVKKISSAVYALKFSEPVTNRGTLTLKTSVGVDASAEVTVDFTAPSNTVTLTISGANTEAGATLNATLVGAVDAAGNVLVDPYTFQITKGAKDGIAPTVSTVTQLSSTEVSVKFSEELVKAPATITVGSVKSSATTKVAQDKADKTKFTYTFDAALAPGLQNVVILGTGITDLSGEALKDYNKVMSITQDTVAPTATAKLAVNKQGNEVIELTFDKDVQLAGSMKVSVSGTSVKDYVTTAVASTDVVAVIPDKKNKKVVHIPVASFATTQGAVYDVTIVNKTSKTEGIVNLGYTDMNKVTVKFTRGTDLNKPAENTDVITAADVSVAQDTDNNLVKVTFDNLNTNKLDGATATNVANYTIPGAVIESVSLADGAGSQVVTLKLKAGSNTVTSARNLTVKNVKLANSTKVMSPVTVAIGELKENVAPTLVSAEVTKVTQGEEAKTAAKAGFYVANGDGTEYTPVKNDTITAGGKTYTYYAQNDEIKPADPSGTPAAVIAAGAGFYEANGDGTEYTPAKNDTITAGGKTYTYYAQNDEIKPAVDAGTEITLTFSENVKTNGAAVNFTVKSGNTAIGTNGIIADDSTADSKTLVVKVDAAITPAQLSAGLTLIPDTAPVQFIVDDAGNKYVVPTTGIVVK